MEMPDGDCTGPRWMRGRKRGGMGGIGRGWNYAQNPQGSFLERLGGMFRGGRGQWMQGNLGYGRGNGRGKGRGKGRGRGGMW